MKTTIAAMAIMLPLAFAACKKKATDAEPKAQIKLLTKIAKVTRGGTDTIYTYIG